MEIQLQELIDRIKKNGVEEAESKAASVLESANAEAERIIADAKAEAESILANAKAENLRFVKASEDAIKQAGRNLLLSFRESVTRELDRVVGASVNELYSSDKLPELIAEVVSEWAKKSDTDDISVILNTAELERLEQSVLSALKARMLVGVTLRAGDNFDGGFRVAVDDGRICYDYSAREVTDMLSGYLSSRVTALLKEAHDA